MTAGALRAGRAAVARKDWAEAYSLLAAEDLGGQLTAKDLEGVGEAAFWVGRLRDSSRYRERSFAAYIDGGLRQAAARVARQVAWTYFMERSFAVGSGWFAKADRLLKEEPECREHGELANSKAHIDIAQGDLESALARAREAFQIGTRLDDGDLQAGALNTEGSVLIRLGRIPEGMARIDESMASAVGGGLEPFTTAAIYCTTISASLRIGDLRRAREWTDAAEHCAQRPGMQDFPGDCRAHRVSILKVNGQWDEAKAAADALLAVDGVEASHLATAHQEIGEICVRRGELDAADQAFCRAEELGRVPQPGRALLCLAQGEIDAAVSLIGAALTEESWDRLARTKLLPAQVDITLAAGSTQTAREAADELREIAETYGTTALAAAAFLAEGRVVAAEGDAEAAVSLLRQALRLWQELPAPFEAASTRLALAQALRVSVGVEAALAETRAALSAFERLAAGPDARRAQQALDELDKARLARADQVERVTRTFMFTDIEGSTSLLEAIGDDAWRNLVRWHDQLLRSQFSSHGGEEIDHAGDGFFVAFESVDAALDCAIAVQRGLARHRQEHGFSPAVRIGVHRAEATSDAEGYAGMGVHHAARIGAVARGGEILVSEATVGDAGAQREMTDRRSVSLKGIGEPCPVVSLTW